jgi:tetratricopeptide (TPR) repeat protein
MKLTISALGIGLAAAAAPAAAQYSMPAPAPQQTVPQPQAEPAQPQLRPSQGAMKAIVALQTAVKANDLANIPAKVAAAQAVAKTKDDKYIIGKLQVESALAAKDNNALSAGIETIAASGFIDSTKVSGLYMGLGNTFYNAKDFARAQAAFERAASLTPRDPEPLVNVAEARFSQGQKAEAVATFQRAIQTTIAAGQKPREGIYKRALGIAYDARLSNSAELGRQWVAAYPGPDSWSNSIAIYRNLTKQDVEGTLDLLRLMQATGALSSAVDYSLFANASAEQLNYNEAQAVLDAGIAAKVVDPASPLFRETVAGLKAKPKATVADLVEGAKAAQSGMALLRIGDRYYGMGDYSKAVELYRQSMGKPGVDPNIANLHTGMALARAGDKAGATAAFNAVTGPRADIAKYWLLYLQTRA